MACKTIDLHPPTTPTSELFRFIFIPVFSSSRSATTKRTSSTITTFLRFNFALSTSFQTVTILVRRTTDKGKTIIKTMASTGDDTPSPSGEPTDANSTPCCSTLLGTILRGAAALLLFVLFGYGAFVQGNDDGAVLMWTIFYIVHALANVVALVGYICTFIESVICTTMFRANLAMIVWSTVLVLITAVQLSKTEHGGDVAGGDMPKAEEREEKAYELAGATLGLVSASCHALYYRLRNKNISNATQGVDNAANDVEAGAS